jgi:hypothetical protein
MSNWKVFKNDLQKVYNGIKRKKDAAKNNLERFVVEVERQKEEALQKFKAELREATELAQQERDRLREEEEKQQLLEPTKNVPYQREDEQEKRKERHLFRAKGHQQVVAWRARLSSVQLIIPRVPLIETVIYQIEDAYNARKPRLDRIPLITCWLIQVLRPLLMFQQYIAIRQRIESEKYGNGVIDLDTLTFGSLCYHLTAKEKSKTTPTHTFA